jgi:hypothetical protein
MTEERRGEMNRRVSVALIAVLVLAGSVPIALAQDTAVCYVPGTHSSIQAAIDDYACATIVVGPGNWAGATVHRGVEIRGEGEAVIDDGPNSHSFLRAGFLFPGSGAGSGTTISGLEFRGTPQFGYTDDGHLDFPIFSRGANNVAVSGNVFVDTLQGVTNWHGTGWHIHHNTLQGLWTLSGGGIGILIASRSGMPANDNVVAFNHISGSVASDSPDYTCPGIALMSDARYGNPGGPVRDNKILHNYVSVDGIGYDMGVGIELTDLPLEDGQEATVTQNKVAQNNPYGDYEPLALNPSMLSDYNVIHNNPGAGAGHGLPPGAYQ